MPIVFHPRALGSVKTLFIVRNNLTLFDMFGAVGAGGRGIIALPKVAYR